MHAHLRNALIIALSLLLGACATAPDVAGEDGRLAIVHVDVFDPMRGDLQGDRTVVIEAGKILSVSPGAAGAPGTGRIIDGRGMTLLPGLINAHVHLQSSQDAEAGLRDLLRRGVTRVRDLGGDVRPLREFNRRATQEGLPIPAIYYSAVVAGPKHMADPRIAASSDGYAPGTAPWMRAYAPGGDVAAIVADAKASGAAGLKLYASLQPAQLAALTAEAKAQGLQVWTHSVIFPANARDAIASRPSQLIHAKGLASRGDDTLPDTFDQGIRRYMSGLPFADLDPAGEPFASMYAEMKAGGVLLEPALVADGDIAIRQGRRPPPPLLAMRDWACRATGAAYGAGVTIGAGTDFDGAGDMLVMELERLHDCGLPRAAALAAATRNNAIALGIADHAGQVAAGFDADLLLVEGNPLDDLAALRQVRYVIRRGEVVRAPE